jgi:hypothetical protein
VNVNPNWDRKMLEERLRKDVEVLLDDGMSATDIASIARNVSRDRRAKGRREVNLGPGEFLVVTAVGDPPPGKVAQLCVGKEPGVVIVRIRYTVPVFEHQEEP